MVTYDIAHDGSLLARIKDGDASALAHLYDRYSQVARRVASRLVGDPTASEEVVQDSFLSVWRHAASYNPGSGSVHNWLFAIVRHRALDTLRRYRPEKHSAAAELPEENGPTVFGMVAERLDRERVRAALRSLPTAQREVIDRIYFKGFTAREVAEQIGVPVGTVKSRLRFALQHLRAELHPDDLTADGYSAAPHIGDSSSPAATSRPE